MTIKGIIIDVPANETIATVLDATFAGRLVLSDPHPLYGRSLLSITGLLEPVGRDFLKIFQMVDDPSEWTKVTVLDTLFGIDHLITADEAGVYLINVEKYDPDWDSHHPDQY